MAELRKRSEVEEKYTWNLKDLYESDDDWQKEFDFVSGNFASIKNYQGKLGEGPETFLNCLKDEEKYGGIVQKLMIYANLKKDEDTANTVYQAYLDKIMGLISQYSAAISFIGPEMLALGEEKVAELINSSADLKIYQHFFSNLFRQQKHVLTPEKEELLALASEIGRAPASIFGMLTNADMEFEPVKDSDGNEHILSTGRFAGLMESTDRTLRKNAFKQFLKTYIKQKNTIAEAYNYSVKNDNFKAKVRNYSSAMQAALSENNIPIEIYENLVNTVNESLPLYHRYIELRKKCLGLDEIHMYDMTVPIVENADTYISWDDAVQTVINGLAPLGEEYVQLVKRAFNERWVDVFENKGKRSGAYSFGVYTAPHPYILMNFDDKIGDMFTLAHEIGHALHSYYTRATQPFVYGRYTIFLAEIASTVNEALVMDYLLKTETDRTKRRYLINYFIQQFVGTFFRQTMFAEFEMITHSMADKGEALNADSLAKVYKELTEKHFKGAVIDEENQYAWSRIPHFYRAYYVYQYATGFSAAMSFYKGILEGGEKREKYLNLLKSGCKNYSIELLKEAGLDMQSPTPIKDAVSIFESLLDRFEAEME